MNRERLKGVNECSDIKYCQTFLELGSNSEGLFRA